MMLVDNFRIILLVALICAAGLRSTDADPLKCKGEDAPCDEKVKSCMIDKAGKAGCGGEAECAPAEDMYCCTEENCNDIMAEGMKGKICTVSKMIEPCKEGTGPTEKTMMDTTAKSTASGMFDTYYGGIPLLTLVSASIYYLPLKSFL